jgi:hypothetical protein
MNTAIVGSDRTIAVLSPKYFQSAFCAAEWHTTFASDPDGRKGLLIPVRVVDFKPNGLLQARIYIDLVGLAELAARKILLESVAKTRVKPSKAGPPSFPTP